MGDMADWSMQRDPEYDDERWEEGGEMSPYDYECILLEREKSWLVRMPGFTERSLGKEIWFPKRWKHGNCVLDEEKKQIWVPRWLAEQKGLI